jgi:hypothetical protein
VKRRSLPRDISTAYWVEGVLAILLLVSIWGWKYAGKFPWWVGLSPFQKRLSEGICLEVVGMIFLWARVKTKRLAPRSMWDLRLLVQALALVVGGVVCFVSAFRLR